MLSLFSLFSIDLKLLLLREKTSVFSSAGRGALSSAELGAFIRASYRPKTFLSTFQIGIEHRGTPSKASKDCACFATRFIPKKLQTTTRDCTHRSTRGTDLRGSKSTTHLRPPTLILPKISRRKKGQFVPLTRGLRRHLTWSNCRFRRPVAITPESATSRLNLFILKI